MTEREDHPDPGWYIEALCQDRGVLTTRILTFLIQLEAEGFSGETIGRVLGPIFGRYIRDHYAGNPKFGTREHILSNLPASMKPELIDEGAAEIEAAFGLSQRRKAPDSTQD